jgi:hypothetical protein
MATTRMMLQRQQQQQVLVAMCIALSSAILAPAATLDTAVSASTLDAAGNP